MGIWRKLFPRAPSNVAPAPAPACTAAAPTQYIEVHVPPGLVITLGGGWILSNLWLSCRQLPGHKFKRVCVWHPRAPIAWHLQPAEYGTSLSGFYCENPN